MRTHVQTVLWRSLVEKRDKSVAFLTMGKTKLNGWHFLKCSAPYSPLFQCDSNMICFHITNSDFAMKFEALFWRETQVKFLCCIKLCSQYVLSCVKEWFHWALINIKTSKWVLHSCPASSWEILIDTRILDFSLIMCGLLSFFPSYTTMHMPV